MIKSLINSIRAVIGLKPPVNPGIEISIAKLGADDLEKALPNDENVETRVSKSLSGIEGIVGTIILGAAGSLLANLVTKYWPKIADCLSIAKRNDAKDCIVLIRYRDGTRKQLHFDLRMKDNDTILKEIQDHLEPEET